MSRKITKLGASLAVLAAVAVGASAIAGAASNTSSSTSTTQAQAPPSQNGYGPPPGGGRPQHKPETRLTGDTATQVKAAALAKVSGGKIIRVETDSDSASPYEAHVAKTDGSQVVVLVNKQFQVTAVNAFGGPGGPGPIPGN
jgi:hypothetical protein